MAVLIRNPNFSPPPSLSTIPVKPARIPLYINFKAKYTRNCSLRSHNFVGELLHKGSGVRFFGFASSGEVTETEEAQQPQIQENADESVDVDSEEDYSSDDKSMADESPTSPITTLLEMCKEALLNNDESKLTELESFIKSIEDEKNELDKKVNSLLEELSIEKERVLRISADFDNFRKRTDRERLSLVTNAQGEVIENLLSVLDNFERAKAQIKVETEGEEKISNSYQSIYKQFTEILSSFGVVPVETVGNPFDPLLHEAIMREESTEYTEGIVIEEYRKGFKIGDRLLRPSTVKVSAGPGPSTPAPSEPSEPTEDANPSDTVDAADTESDPTDETTP